MCGAAADTLQLEFFYLLFLILGYVFAISFALKAYSFEKGKKVY